MARRGPRLGNLVMRLRERFVLTAPLLVHSESHTVWAQWQCAISLLEPSFRLPLPESDPREPEAVKL